MKSFDGKRNDALGACQEGVDKSFNIPLHIPCTEEMWIKHATDKKGKKGWIEWRAANLRC